MSIGMVILNEEIVDLQYRTTLGKTYAFIICRDLDTNHTRNYWGECLSRGDLESLQEIIEYGSSWSNLP
jgi:hypothetical protein